MPKVRKMIYEEKKLTCFQNNKKGNDCIGLCGIS